MTFTGVSTAVRVSSFSVVLLAAGCDRPSQVQETGRILFFYDDDCPDCKFIKERLLDRFLFEIGLEQGDIVWIDVEDPEAVLLLSEIEEKLGRRTPALAPVIVAGKNMYCSPTELEKGIWEHSERP